MNTVRKLSYRSDLSELGRICSDVSDYCREHGIDSDTTLALTLCLDELFTNTLKYGYGTAPATAQSILEDAAKYAHTIAEQLDIAEQLVASEPLPNAEQLPNSESLANAEPLTDTEGLTDTDQLADAIADLLVEIHLERHDDRVLVYYCDRGQPSDPFDNLPPLPDVATIAPETLPTGGFGIHLLRKLCSEASYARKGDCNTVSLSFRSFRS